MRKKHGAVKNTSHEHERNTVYVMLSDAVLRSELTDLQYAVTQKKATEQPFHNAYDHEFREGIYCDVTTGQPLFVSTDQYDSGSGWPTFSRCRFVNPILH